jgi:hypothetical protein
MINSFKYRGTCIFVGVLLLISCVSTAQEIKENFNKPDKTKKGETVARFEGLSGLVSTDVKWLQDEGGGAVKINPLSQTENSILVDISGLEANRVYVFSAKLKYLIDTNYSREINPHLKWTLSKQSVETIQKQKLLDGKLMTIANKSNVDQLKDGWSRFRQSLYIEDKNRTLILTISYGKSAHANFDLLLDDLMIKEDEDYQSLENLVLNGDFEITKRCPVNYYNVFPSLFGWNDMPLGYKEYAKGLDSGIVRTYVNENGQEISISDGVAYLGTPDEVHCCADGKTIGRDHKLLIRAAAGYGYAKLNVLTRKSPSEQQRGREYLQGILKVPLQKGQIYEMSMYLRKGEESPYANNAIGVVFSDDRIFSSQSLPHHSLQMQWNAKELMLSDSAIAHEEWKKYDLSYKAVGGEQFITIGDFRRDESSVVVKEVSYRKQSSSIYYVDEVVLRKATFANESQVHYLELKPSSNLELDSTLNLVVSMLNLDTESTVEIFHVLDLDTSGLSRVGLAVEHLRKAGIKTERISIIPVAKEDDLLLSNGDYAKIVLVPR